MLYLGLTLIIAILGGYIADKKRIPAGYMIGALFAVAIFQIFFEKASLPSSFRFLTQTATGTFLGAKFRSEDMKALRKVFIPGIIMTFLMIAFSFGIVLSFIFYFRNGSFDFCVCEFSRWTDGYLFDCL